MKIPFVSEYADYFRTLKQYAGKSLYVLMGISLVVAATDGIGITMLLPLLKASDMGEGGLGEGGDFFNQIFNFLGIPLTFEWVLGVMGLLFLTKGLIKYLEGYLGAIDPISTVYPVAETIAELLQQPGLPILCF